MSAPSSSKASEASHPIEAVKSFVSSAFFTLCS
jgi:hypothetical protein